MPVPSVCLRLVVYSMDFNLLLLLLLLLFSWRGDGGEMGPGFCEGNDKSQPRS